VVDKCCMCKRNWEFMNHLLLHFEVACAIWNVFFSRFGLSWVKPRRVSRLVCLLVDCRQHSKCCCVKDGAFVHFVVSMEGNE
jgi:hypothetical protein